MSKDPGVTELRYVLRNGEKVLQQRHELRKDGYHYDWLDWIDVPVVEEEV